MEFDMTRHLESVVIQAPLNTLKPLIKVCEDAQIKHHVKALDTISELVIPLEDKPSRDAFKEIEKRFDPTYLYLEYSSVSPSERWYRNGRHYYKTRRKEPTGPVHAFIQSHFNDLLKPLDIDPSFYASTLYIDMLYYIMSDYITGSSRYIHHSPNPISDDYVKLIKRWDPATLKKYQGHKLQTLEDLNLI